MTTMFGVLFLSIGYAAFQTIININVIGNIKRDETCVNGHVLEFEQKNEGQEFKVPCSGEYKVELWGASGGDSLEDTSSGLQGTSIGGEGGYTSGIISIKKRQNLYLYVGSQGENRTYNSGIGVFKGDIMVVEMDMLIGLFVINR